MAKSTKTGSSYTQLRAGNPQAPGIRHERGDPALASPTKPTKGGTGKGASNQIGGPLRMPGSK